MELHPYDGIERRFCHTDADREAGLAVVAELLHLPYPRPGYGVFYDLSFYSGGIGVLDRLAITMPANPAIWANAIGALKAKSLEDALGDPSWAEDFLWLITKDEVPVPPRLSAVQFINGERREFQPACQAAHRILFADGSNVNTWAALWGDDTRLSYCGYDQG